MRLEGLRHTRHGWWLEDAGPVEPTRALSEDTSADVVVIGGGYLGLWTAWQLKQLEPSLDVVVVEAHVCGHGPSGRNGGFVSTLWDDLPILRDRCGDARAVAVCRASERAVHGIGTWCSENGVDAWYRVGGTIQVASAPNQVGEWDELIDALAAVGAADKATVLSREDLAARCRSPLFEGGALLRLSATVQPARLSLGLRARVIEAGVRVYEHTAVKRIVAGGTEIRTERARVTAGASVLAVNSAAAGFPGFRLSLAVASSHMVITEPVPEVIEAIGWTGGEAINDCRTMLHYLRTTRDGRIAFGWGGGRMGLGAARLDRLELDRQAIEHTARSLVSFFPELADRRITNAWGGPIDVSPTHLPSFGSRDRLHYGFGFTGNGVGPAYLGGEILARLALDRRDETTGLALVEPDRKLFPPEPIRWAGGTLIRGALVRRDAAEAAGREVDPITGLVASLPRRLGLRLPR